jgi:hypothetical protein
MNFYQTFVDIYTSFLSLFPVQLQWVITLLFLIGLVGAFIALIRYNALFLILLILLLPFVAPILQRFFQDLYNFFLYLVHSLSAQAPK